MSVPHGVVDSCAVEPGRDGDRSLQACWTQEDGLQSGHHDRSVPQVREGGRETDVNEQCTNPSPSLLLSFSIQ